MQIQFDTKRETEIGLLELSKIALLNGKSKKKSELFEMAIEMTSKAIKHLEDDDFHNIFDLKKS